MAMETEMMSLGTLHEMEKNEEPDGEAPGMFGLLTSVNLDITEVFNE